MRSTEVDQLQQPSGRTAPLIVSLRSFSRQRRFNGMTNVPEPRLMTNVPEPRLLRVRFNWAADPLGGALKSAYDVTRELPDAMQELLARLGFRRCSAS